MANDRDIMFREIEGELRREQMARLWDRYGVYAIILTVLLIAGVGGYQWWTASSISASQQAGARYEAAVLLQQQGKAGESRQAFEELAKSSPASYEALARMQLAAAANAAGNTDEALAAYDGIVANAKVDQTLRDYARLQSAALKLDTADFTEMQNRLTPLLAETNAWRHGARELLGLSAYRAGQLDDARQTFLELAADQKTPASMRERVGVMMALITSAEAAKAAPAAQPAAGGAPAEAPKGQ